MATINYLGDGGPDGTVVGRSGGKVGFYGATPVVQQTVGTTAITTVVATVLTSTVWATAINDLIAWRSEVNTALTNLGLRG